MFYTKIYAYFSRSLHLNKRYHLLLPREMFILKIKGEREIHVSLKIIYFSELCQVEYFCLFGTLVKIITDIIKISLKVVQ